MPIWRATRLSPVVVETAVVDGVPDVHLGRPEGSRRVVAPGVGHAGDTRWGWEIVSRWMTSSPTSNEGSPDGSSTSPTDEGIVVGDEPRAAEPVSCTREQAPSESDHEGKHGQVDGRPRG